MFSPPQHDGKTTSPNSRLDGWRRRDVGRWVALLVACGFGPAGCADLVRQASHTAVPIVVSSGLGELATPQSQAQLKSIAGSPAVQEAGYGVGLGIGRGFIDEGVAFVGGDTTGNGGGTGVKAGAAAGAGGGKGVAIPVGGIAADAPNTPATQPSATSRPAPGPATAAATPAPATQPSGGRAAAFVQGSVVPMVSEVVRTAVTEGMRDALGTDGRAQVRAMAETAGDAVVAGMSRAAERDGAPVLGRLFANQLGPAIDEAVRRRLGPALHDVLRDQVSPVARTLVAECVRDTLEMPVRPEHSRDVITNAKNVSLGASLGTHEAMIELGVLDGSGQLSKHMRLSVWGGVTLLALLGTAALVLLVLRILIAVSTWRRPRPAVDRG